MLLLYYCVVADARIDALPCNMLLVKNCKKPMPLLNHVTITADALLFACIINNVDDVTISERAKIGLKNTR